MGIKLDKVTSASKAARIRPGGTKELKNNKTAFICAPFTGDTENNIIKAAALARAAHAAGYTPVVPHLNLLFFNADIPSEDADAIKQCFSLILACKVFILDNSRGISKNMKKEIIFARTHQKTIIFADALIPNYKLLNYDKIQIIIKLLKAPFGRD